MALVRGPFSLAWGANTITDVESVAVDYSVKSNEYETLDGRTQEIDGAVKASVTVVLLASDIPALAAILPQHYVAQGATASTGEVVSHSDGMIDVEASNCETAITYNNLDIISCGDPANVYRLVNARTRVEAVDIDSSIRKVSVKFIGEPASDEASIQFFREGTLDGIS
jgi:hypothetical protein